MIQTWALVITIVAYVIGAGISCVIYGVLNALDTKKPITSLELEADITPLVIFWFIVLPLMGIFGIFSLFNKYTNQLITYVNNIIVQRLTPSKSTIVATTPEEQWIMNNTTQTFEEFLKE